MFEAHAQVYIYRITLLVVVFLFALLLPFSRPDVRRGIVGGRGLLFLLSLFCICFIGIQDWRVEEVFVDSVRYAASYLFYLSGYVPNMGEVKDVGYESFALLCKLGFVGRCLFLFVRLSVRCSAGCCRPPLVARALRGGVPDDYHEHVVLQLWCEWHS